MSALNQYGHAFRKLINTKVRLNDQSIRELLKLNKASDWRFICAAMDVVGDSESAIDSFNRFGLEGPSRYDDIGEKYLRLYGLLSATYLQQESIVELYRLMNLPKLKEARKKVLQLKIRQVRNKLASHSVNHKNLETEDIEAFAPVQISLKGFNCEIASLTLELPEKIDLKTEIKSHSELLVSLMDDIYEKSYQTLFKGHKKRLVEHRKILDDLRVIKDGGVVVNADSVRVLIHALDVNL